MRALILACLTVTAVSFATTPSFAVVKGGDLPRETCALRNANGTLTTGLCSVVCKDKTIYEPDTDAEVDAVSSGGGVCNAAKTKVPLNQIPLVLDMAPS